MNTVLREGLIINTSDNVINLSDFKRNTISKENEIPEGYTTGTIFRRDRTIIQNLKRLWIVICRDTIAPILYQVEDSKYYLIKDRRGI